MAEKQELASVGQDGSNVLCVSTTFVW